LPGFRGTGIYGYIDMLVDSHYLEEAVGLGLTTEVMTEALTEGMLPFIQAVLARILTQELNPPPQNMAGHKQFYERLYDFRKMLTLSIAFLPYDETLKDQILRSVLLDIKAWLKRELPPVSETAQHLLDAALADTTGGNPEKPEAQA